MRAARSARQSGEVVSPSCSSDVRKADAAVLAAARFEPVRFEPGPGGSSGCLRLRVHDAWAPFFVAVEAVAVDAVDRRPRLTNILSLAAMFRLRCSSSAMEVKSGMPQTPSQNGS